MAGHGQSVLFSTSQHDVHILIPDAEAADADALEAVAKVTSDNSWEGAFQTDVNKYYHLKKGP